MIEALVVKVLGVVIIGVALVIEFRHNLKDPDCKVMTSAFVMKLVGAIALFIGLATEVLIATKAV